MVMDMKLQMVDLHGQYLKIKKEVDTGIRQVIETSAFINGPQVKEFASNLATYSGCKHVITCGNGTDALQIALMSLGLKPGDEVIDWTQGSRRVFNFIRALSIPGPQATSWIDGKKITINKARMVAGAHAYVNIPGQVLGKTECGFYVKTGDTMLEVVEYTYDGRIKVGDRLKTDE